MSFISTKMRLHAILAPLLIFAINKKNLETMADGKLNVSILCMNSLMQYYMLFYQYRQPLNMRFTQVQLTLSLRNVLTQFQMKQPSRRTLIGLQMRRPLKNILIQFQMSLVVTIYNIDKYFEI